MNTRRALLAFHLLAAALLPASGCTHTRTEALEWRAPAPEFVEFVTDAASGMAIDVENFRGSVEIVVEPWRDDVLVKVDKRVTGYGTDQDMMRLSSVDIAHEIRTDDGPPVLVVRSTTSEPEQEGQFADIRIYAPHCGGVRVWNAGGKVTVRGASGAHQVENSGGPITIRTEAEIHEPVLLSTTKGDIRLRVSHRSSGLIEARTEEGRVYFDGWSSDVTKWRMTAGVDSLAGVVNDGENPITIRTGEGDVTLDWHEETASSPTDD